MGRPIAAAAAAAPAPPPIYTVCAPRTGQWAHALPCLCSALRGPERWCLLWSSGRRRTTLALGPGSLCPVQWVLTSGSTDLPVNSRYFTTVTARPCPPPAPPRDSLAVRPQLPKEGPSDPPGSGTPVSEAPPVRDPSPRPRGTGGGGARRGGSDGRGRQLISRGSNPEGGGWRGSAGAWAPRGPTYRGHPPGGTVREVGARGGGRDHLEDAGCGGPRCPPSARPAALAPRADPHHLAPPSPPTSGPPTPHAPHLGAPGRGLWAVDAPNRLWDPQSLPRGRRAGPGSLGSERTGRGRAAEVIGPPTSELGAARTRGAQVWSATVPRAVRWGSRAQGVAARAAGLRVHVSPPPEGAGSGFARGRPGSLGASAGLGPQLAGPPLPSPADTRWAAKVHGAPPRRGAGVRAGRERTVAHARGPARTAPAPCTAVPRGRRPPRDLAPETRGPGRGHRG